MKEREAKQFAYKEFKKLGILGREWNLLHARCMIKVLSEFSKTKNLDLNKLKALAWVHDIGKIKNKEKHAKAGVEIIKKKFYIDKIDKDCILNHGATGKPKTKMGEVFRVADGISIFDLEAILFRFYAQAKEGYKFEEIHNEIKKLYKKYLRVYAKYPFAIKILKRKYGVLKTFNLK